MKHKSKVANVLTSVIMVIGMSVATGGIGHCQQDKTPSVDIEKLFTPSGWMGDGEYGRKYIDFTAADSTSPHSPPHSIKVAYTFGPKKWGGIYWQNKPDNWGEKSGADYTGKGFSRISFWARGASGGEVVEFKAGGIGDPKKAFRDSFETTIGRVTLTKEWKQYVIEVSKMDLSSVIGVFCWVASQDFNSAKRISFYLDDIVLH